MNTKLSMDSLNRISIQEFKRSEKTPITIILDNIRSMNNIGSVFRTSDAFRIEKIWLCGITATPPHREINKTALGATDSVEWEYCSSCIQCVNNLKEKNYKIYSIEQTTDSIMLEDFQIKQTPIAIVFGNEVDGVEQEVINVSDGVIEIPQFGTKHSLNISVSCGIVVWELFKKIQPKY